MDLDDHLFPGIGHRSPTPPLPSADAGRIEINQTAALTGNITPGDSAGFPVTLSLPGSYILSSDLTVPDENTSAIVLDNAADFSSIDLNGFSIRGPTAEFNMPPIATEPHSMIVVSSAA